MLTHIMKPYRATPYATGESANNIMFGREPKLPDMLAFGNKVKETQFHSDFAVNQQARIKGICDSFIIDQWSKMHSHSIIECMIRTGYFCFVDIPATRKGVKPKMEPS